MEGLDWYWGIWFGGNFATATVTGTWLPTAPRTQNHASLRRHELDIEESEGTIMHTKTLGFWECGSPEVDGLDASEPKDRNYPGHMGVTTGGRRRDRDFEVLQSSGTSQFSVCKLNGTLASERIWQNTSWTQREGGSIKESDARPEGCKKVVDKVWASLLRHGSDK